MACEGNGIDRGGLRDAKGKSYELVFPIEERIYGMMRTFLQVIYYVRDTLFPSHSLGQVF